MILSNQKYQKAIDIHLKSTLKLWVKDWIEGWLLVGAVAQWQSTGTVSQMPWVQPWQLHLFLASLSYKYPLGITQTATTQPSQGNQHVVNLSSKQLQDFQVLALSIGLIFAIAPGCIPLAHFITSVEAAINWSGVDENVAAKARINVTGAVNYEKMPPRNISPKDLKVLKEFASDEDNLVLPPDKDRVTVVMDRTDYGDKMLSEESTYQAVEKDPKPVLDRKMNAQLMSLKLSGRLPNDLYMQLRNLAGRVPLLYGLPKVHKLDAPFYPIVSFMTSSTYQLSMFLASILAPLVGWTSSYVKNSKSFVEFIVTQALAKEILVSFHLDSNRSGCPGSPSKTRRGPIHSRENGLVCRLHRVSINLVPGCYLSTFWGEGLLTSTWYCEKSIVGVNLIMEDVEERALATSHSPLRFWEC